MYSARIGHMAQVSRGLKLVSLNIEGSKHLDLVLSFLEREAPDVVCVQELFESDAPLFESRLGMEHAFAPICRWDQDGSKAAPEPWGVAIFSKLSLRNVRVDYYVGNANSIPVHTRGKPETLYNALLSAEVAKDGTTFTVGTTHFVWTPNGEADDRQRRALAPFFKILATYPEITFSGDFNAPRGKEVFDAIAARYKDNIPVEYKTSLNGGVHRAGKLELMVDGLFTTPQYVAEGTKLVGGVSDHMAIVSHIRRAI